MFIACAALRLQVQSQLDPTVAEKTIDALLALNLTLEENAEARMVYQSHPCRIDWLGTSKDRWQFCGSREERTSFGGHAWLLKRTEARQLICSRCCSICSCCSCCRLYRPSCWLLDLLLPSPDLLLPLPDLPILLPAPPLRLLPRLLLLHFSRRWTTAPVANPTVPPPAPTAGSPTSAPVAGSTAPAGPPIHCRYIKNQYVYMFLIFYHLELAFILSCHCPRRFPLCFCFIARRAHSEGKSSKEAFSVQ
jgi:hypothetical protein